MKYSNRYDKKLFIIEEDLRDNKELLDIDINNINIVFKKKKYIDIEID